MAVVPLSRAKLSTPTVLEDRRAMVQAARDATGRNEASPAKPHVLAPARTSPPLEQAFRVAAAWAYITPFLIALPFFASPPAWIMAFSQVRPRDDAASAPRPKKDVLDNR
jgi:hypothetical protein